MFFVQKHTKFGLFELSRLIDFAVYNNSLTIDKLMNDVTFKPSYEFSDIVVFKSSQQINKNIATSRHDSSR